jgi:GntR family transcriptional regulator, transcriptional repressor for pyruvate dehydrogenase complex
VVTFDAIPKVDLSNAVVDQVRDAILLGQLAPGDTLPSERELAVQLGVNRTTVREALMKLELLGLIDRGHGRLCKVLDYRRHGSTALVPHLVRLRIEGAAEAFVESIAITYGGAVGLAAQRATPADLQAIEHALVELEGAIAAGEPEAIVAADREFHHAVAAASHSVVLELMTANHYRTFDGAFDARGRVKQSQVEVLVERHRQGRSLSHRRIYEAIVAGDEALAREVATALVTRSPRGSRPRERDAPGR